MSCYAKFYTYSNFTYVSTSPGTYEVLKASFDQKLLMIGTGNCTIPMQSTMSPQILVGKYCCVYTYDEVAAANVIVSQFFVEKASEVFQLGGKLYSTLSGPSAESELDKIRAYGDVGTGAFYKFTIKYGLANHTDFYADDWYGSSTTLVQTLHITEDDAAVADNSAFSVGDTVQFKEETGWPKRMHTATVTNLYNDGSYDRIEFTPALSGFSNCDNGQPVVKASIEAGMSVEIDLADSRPTHYTYITAVGEDWGEFTLADPLPYDVLIGGDFVAITTFVPNSQDVTLMLADYGEGWTNDFSGTGDEGTTNGTAWRLTGQSLRSMLETMQEASAGEFWRLQLGDADGPPVRKIEWHRASDSSGITVRLKPANDPVTDYANTAIAVPIEKPVYREAFDAVSHITPYGVGGPNGGHTLANRTTAIDTGYTLDTESGQVYILSKDATSAVYHNHQIKTFSNIEPSANTAAERERASNLLYESAKNYLDLFSSTGEELLEVITMIHGEIYAGQSVTLDIVLDDNFDGIWYIVGYNHWVSPDEKGGSLRYTRLMLSKRLWPDVTAQDQLMKAVRDAGTLSADGVVAPLSNLPGGGGSAPVDTDDFLHADGSVELTGNQSVSSGITIDGVDISAHAVDPDAHHTPGTLTAATTNTNSGIEYHAITTTADGQTTPSTILAPDANGAARLARLGVNEAAPAWDGLTVSRIENASGDMLIAPAVDLNIDGDIEFQGAQLITTSADDLGISPAGNLILTPAGEFVTLGAGAVDPTIKTDDWSSGFLGTGWGVDHTGHGDFRSIYADELHVTHFTAEHLRVKSGGEWITPSTSTLTADMTVPAVSSTTTIYVDDVPGLQAMPVFAENDYVLMRVFDNTAGALNIFNVWGQVTSYVDQGDGTQAWTFTTRSASQTGDTIKQGSTVVDFGQSGDGGIFLNAVDEAGAPYIDMFRWYNNPYTASNRTHPIRLGDLGGTGAEIKGVMGLFIGDVAGKYLVFSERKAEMHGVGLSLYDHANNDSVIKFDYIRVAVDYDGGTDNMDPNADVATVGDFTTSTSSLQTSTGTTYYNLIDNATTPDSAWVGNVAGQSATLLLDLDSMTSSFSNTIKVTISGYLTASTGAGNLRVLVDILDNLGERITTTGELANETTAGGATSVELRPLKVLTEADWDDAIINIGWVFTPSGLATEAIKLDPTVPSIAVGDPLPTMTTGEGFWVGNYSGYYRMRIGKAGGSGMGWNGLQMTFTDSGGNNVITLDSTGNAEFTGTIDMGASGEVVAGATVFDDGGIGIGTYSGGTPAVDDKVSFWNSTPTEVAYIACDYSGVPAYTSLNLVVDSDNYLTINDTNASQLNTERFVLNLDSTNEGLVINQFDNDGAILQLRSTDVTGMTSQGLYNSNTYFQISKTSGGDGGAFIKAGGESNHALWFVGSAATADTTESSAARAPIILSGREDNAALANDENVVVWQNYTTGLMILKGDGELHNTYSTAMTNNFDEYDDVGLIRTFARSIGDTIQGNWDKFVTYNADDLDRLGIMNKDGFVSQQKMTMLQIGALWQLHERIAALEGKHETK